MKEAVPAVVKETVLVAVKKWFRQLVFPTSRRRKYYVATQELLRGDVGKGVWAKAAIHLAVVEQVKKVKRQKVKSQKSQKSKRSKVTFHDLSLLMFLYLECSI